MPPRRPSLLTADDRDRVLEIAYDVRYGTIDPPVIRLRSGASVEVAVSADGKAIRLTRIGGPQHGKVTRLAFDPGARLRSGTKRPAGRKTATRRKVPNPSDESPYEVGIRVGRMNAETALEMLDEGIMELDGDTRSGRVREYAEIASFEQSEDGAVFYDDPVMNGGRYTWEDYERGVRRGIDQALDRDRPVRSPARKRRPKAKRPAARRAPKRRR